MRKLFSLSILMLVFTAAAFGKAGFSISPTSLNFNTVLIGNTSSIPVTITNDGNTQLVISSITSSDTQFVFGVPAPIQIPEGGSTTVNVSFTPVREGSQLGYIIFTHNAPGFTNSLPVMGIGKMPEFQVTPELLAFGTVNVGTTSELTLTITNTRTQPLVISNISTTNTHYTFTSGTLPITLNPTETTTVNVTFTPTLPGTDEGNLVITHNGSGSPRLILLTGTGHIPAPGINVSPTTLAFGDVVVGSNGTLALTVNNTGDADLVISDITSSNTDYTFTADALPITILPGGNTVINVTFTPAGAGAVNADLVITHNAAGSPTSVAMSGTGLIAGFELSATSLTFGTVNVGSTSMLPVTITNTGGAPLEITNITSSDAHYTFTSAALPVTIPAGGTSTVEVTFTPTVEGPVNADLVITHNAAGSPSTVTLTGTGHILTAVIGFSPASMNFDTVIVGNNSTIDLTINNTGDGTLVISNITSSEAQYTFTAGTLPISIAPGTNTIIPVQFTPTASGIVNGSLTFSHNAGEGTSEYTLLGVGKLIAFQLSVSISNSWNMVSVPGIHPVNQNVDTWWVNRNPNGSVYTWTTEYVPVTVATPGQGYWMIHNGDQVYNTGDEWPASGIQVTEHLPIQLIAGWNMIGGYEDSVAVASLTTNPPNIVQPQGVFGWQGEYMIPTYLKPGYGYWIYASAAGILDYSGGAGNAFAKKDNKDDLGRITLTSASGKSFALYTVNGQTDLDSYLMPPPPPSGCFDVRYSSGRRAENISKGSQVIELRGVDYPVTITSDKTALRIQDETGKIINKRIIPGETLTISNKEISKLLVCESVVPKDFSLEQNYPNPFNPSTLIEFTLPEDAVNVSLIVYDALGQKVQELVSGSKEAGYYKYQWNASNLASGLYIYQLRTDKFVSTKKMMLLK